MVVNFMLLLTNSVALDKLGLSLHQFPFYTTEMFMD